MPNSEPARVSQADRDAAADLLRDHNGGVFPPLRSLKAIRLGLDDGHPLVQAFARHRLASTPPTSPGWQDIAGAKTEALEKIVEFARAYFEPWGSWKTEWWEGEVSDEAAFSGDNALKHAANIANAALKSPAAPECGR